MIKSKVIKIEDQEFTIKELRVRDIYEMMRGDDDSILNRLDDVLERCSDIERDQLMDMTPTDLQSLWEAFKEVNSSFLDMAAMAGFDNLPQMVKENLQDQLALSLQQGTDQ